MNVLELALVLATIALPLHWLMRREISKLSDPRHLRSEGVVIVSERVLEGHSAPIGTFMGREIWESVTFMGMEYRFDRVVPRSYGNRIGPRELYLEPGLVYVTD